MKTMLRPSFGIGLLLVGLICVGLNAPAVSQDASPADTKSPRGPSTSGESRETQSSEIEYNRDIRPILAENCFSCHGPDSASRKADLRLDQREAAVEMYAIVPGKPDESSMIDRILSSDPDEVMPPIKTKKHLTDQQKDLLKRWIAAGAKYEPHWSFIAPVRPEIPEGKKKDWVRNPIDAFVLAQLEAEGLSPAPEADRRTLARRLSLDLIGLPPKPEAVEAFVADESPDAYEKYVDSLLASPHWGEHRGRYWLDLARYGDTHGIHHDNFREMWTYRDWVIEAFNKNQSFDQFTIEQLAGDLLPKRTLDQQVASGFNRCNITTSEGGAIDEEYLVLYTRDRTETTSQVWLGLTTGCAVCHDHKFDPISQREFYELAAFFNNTTQKAMDGNVPDTPPIVRMPAPQDRERLEKIETQLADVRGKMESRKTHARAEFDKWLETADLVKVSSNVPTDGLTLHLPLMADTGNTLDVIVNGKTHPTGVASAAWEDGPHGLKALKLEPTTVLKVKEVGNFSHTQAFTMSAWVKFTEPEQHGAILGRMDEKRNYRGWDFWVQGNRIGMHLIYKWPDNAVKVVANAQVPTNEWHHVLVSYDGSGKADGVRVYYDGEVQGTTPEQNYITRQSRVNVPLQLGQRSEGARLSNVVLHDVRLYTKALDPQDVVQLAKSGRIGELGRKEQSLSEQERDELFAWWLKSIDSDYKALSIEEAKLVDEQTVIENRFTVAHVMEERKEPAMAYILNRGEYDKRGDAVRPDTPDILPAFDESFPKNRLGFAKWLLLPEHPLTARVTVNRFWQELFGTGIVRTAGDFGVSGELPTNQPLLDWMAVEFRESGWDVKKFYKLMVMSSTYRQSAVTTPEKLEKDPQNRLLSRGPRFRMDAEMVRDYALACSDLLVPKIGGPSVKPYQPPGVWEAVAMTGSNTSRYVQDHGENLYRRSFYTFWKRAAPPASMEVFNAPAREVCTVRRERTNTPLQALATLNDVQMVEAARHLAEVVLKSGDSEDDRLQAMALRLLSRPWSEKELAVLRSSLADLASHYAKHDDDAKKLITVGESKPDEALEPAELAAWTMLANQAMNLDEVLNK